MRDFLKALLNACCHLLITPRVITYRVATLAIGVDRAFESSMQTLATLPGMRGEYLRRAFLRRIGVRCDPTATLCFGTLLSKRGAIIEQNVYVGPRCHLGLVHIERDVLLAAGVHIPSGARMHGIDDPAVPIRQQQGTVSVVRIGAGSWIGSGAVVLADVGCNSVIGAGAVVTKPIPGNVVAAGVPARVVRQRVAGGEAVPS